MKKRLSMALTSVMAVNTLAQPILAKELVVEEKTTKETKKVTSRTLGEMAYGKLEVVLDFALPVETTEQMSLKLINDSEEEGVLALDTAIRNVQLGDRTYQTKIEKLNGYEEEVNDGENLAYYKLTIYNLPKGNYNLSLQGQGYAPYELKNIELETHSKKVTITNEKGQFSAGDVDGNGQVNQEDYEALSTYLQGNLKENGKQFDLNRDGKIDLVDLSYISHNMMIAFEQAKIQNTSAIIDLSQIELEESDLAAGSSIEALFKESDEVVTLEGKTQITTTSPVQLQFGFKEAVETEQITIASGLNPENSPSSLKVMVTDEAGNTYPYHYKAIMARTSQQEVPIVIDLGRQIAVKKITICVTGTKGNTNLAEISKVEFLNNVYEELPEVDMNIPTGLKAEIGHESAKLSWQAQTNITGYEVKVIANGKTVIYQTKQPYYELEDLDNYTTYTVSVQSVNGNWSSGYSPAIAVIPMPNRVPPAPENISLKGNYRSLTVSWKKMKDTRCYSLYYRPQGETLYECIPNIDGNTYLLENLVDETTYEVYLVGHNELGTGAKSNSYTGKTASILPPDTHNYKLINRPTGENSPSLHIKGVTYPVMPTQEGFDAFDVVDNDYTSYWQWDGWNSGGYGGNKVAPIIEFDQAYEMNEMILVAGENEPSYYEYMQFVYWDEAGNATTLSNRNGITIKEQKSPNGKKYYSLRMNEPIRAQKVQINLALYWAGAPNARIRISELKFYEYDSLEDEVEALFTDNLHLELQKEVTLETIEALEERAYIQDEISGEYHPNQVLLLKELAYAKEILMDTAASEVIEVDQTLSNSGNGHLGFAMSLNDFQPLGIVAKPGESLAVYVGTTATVMPQLVFTQYYPESGAWKTSVTDLKVGKNTITVPQIGSMATERGGSVYIRYPKNTPSTSPIKVRVTGGEKIPTLDLHHLNLLDEATEIEAKTVIKAYLEALNTHVTGLQAYYEALGESYDPKTSILNTTEVATKNILLSIPASQALKGTEANSLTEQVETVYESMVAFEEMMALFYKEKGLSSFPDFNEDGSISSEEAKHYLPSSRINIRYTRMFDGAFMYASGEHIGVEFDSTSPLMSGKSLKNENFNGFFGWGISHEIGHVIDEGDMIFGETSNNIYSLFAQTADDQQLSRLEYSNFYPKIYEKVTSQTQGIATNVFISLGMFWQLHLAYDEAPTLELMDSFYAKLNRLYRITTEKADKEQLLIRLASDAVQKDLSTFFVKWGLVPNEDTLAYLKAKGYEPETRSIWYLNDEARRSRLAGKLPMAKDTAVEASLEVGKSGTVTLNFDTVKEETAIIGYEILRNGEPIGFTTEPTYTDYLGALNNRAFTYEVVAYDHELNQTSPKVLDEIKVQHDGTITNQSFNIISNYESIEDAAHEGHIHEPNEAASVNLLIDEDVTTYFNGTEGIDTKDKPYVILEFNEKMPISGFKYTAATTEKGLLENTIQNYELYVSEDGNQWTLAKKGCFENLSAENPVAQVYFDKEGVTGGNQLHTYEASYVKLVALDTRGISGAEINVLAPPGDNIELEEMGILTTDYQYGETAEQVLPADSVIFKGTYRGNPAYNAFLITDRLGQVASGEALLMASLPENAALEEIASGNWLFAMTQETYAALEGEVKVTLYRVNDAETNEGQRVVSDTKYMPLKQNLPPIVLAP